jgi:hypothetical protein
MQRNKTLQGDKKSCSWLQNLAYPRELSLQDVGFWQVAVCLPEWIHDLYSVDVSRIWHVFREEDGTARLSGGADDQCIPEGKSVKPVQVDCGENVFYAWSCDIKFSDEFNLAAGNARVHL